MSGRTEKKRKGADGGAVKVESGSASTVALDDSKLSPIQKLLRRELQKAESDAVEGALTDLADLCVSVNNGAADNRAAVFRAGGAALIVGAMEKWNDDPAIQAEGCRALGNASCNNNDSKALAKDTGAIDAVLWAMQNYPSNSDAQENGCVALGNFFTVKSHAKYIVKECDGAGLMVAAMNKFEDNAGLQKWVCSALEKLLNWDDDEIKTAIVEAGGRRALVEAIENHKDETKEHVNNLQEKAKAALIKLCE